MPCENSNVVLYFERFYIFERSNFIILLFSRAYCISGTLEIDKSGTQVGPWKLTRVGPKWDPEIDKGGTQVGPLKLTRVGPKWDPGN